MAKPSFDKFTDMLDEAVNRIPPPLCKYLTGGFNLQEGKKQTGNYYILGEYYNHGHLGCFIMFYYGSFVEVLKDKPLEIWEAEIMETVRHELRHHLEAQAGRDDLVREEMAELAKALHEEWTDK